jgi:hypothetical protein
LNTALEHPLAFAVKPKAQFRTVGGWHDAPSQTEAEIQAKIKEDVATFSNGQVFIDLGAFLTSQVKDEKVSEYFKKIFRVNEFIQLQAVNPDLQPKVQAIKPQEITPKIVESHATPHTNFTDLYSKIRAMREFGESLLAVDNKRCAVITLADTLKVVYRKVREGRSRLGHDLMALP